MRWDSVSCKSPYTRKNQHPGWPQHSFLFKGIMCLNKERNLQYFSFSYQANQLLISAFHLCRFVFGTDPLHNMQFGDFSMGSGTFFKLFIQRKGTSKRDVSVMMITVGWGWTCICKPTWPEPSHLLLKPLHRPSLCLLILTRSPCAIIWLFHPSRVPLCPGPHAHHWPSSQNNQSPGCRVSATPTEDAWHWFLAHFLLGEGVGKSQWPKAILFLWAHEVVGLQGLQSARTELLGQDVMLNNTRKPIR